MNTLYPFIAMAGPAGQNNNQNPWTFPVMMVLFFAIMYVMMIRPQQRKEKERRAMLDNLKKDDKVLFAGGLIGVIDQIDGKVAKIKVSDSLKLEVARGAITMVITDEKELIDPVGA